MAECVYIPSAAVHARSSLLYQHTDEDSLTHEGIIRAMGDSDCGNGLAEFTVNAN